MQAGELLSTLHRPDLFVNRLTSSVRDRLVRTPEYKVAVRHGWKSWPASR